MLLLDVEKCGNECKTTIICIDSYEKRIPKGSITNPCYSSGVSFEGMVDFIYKIQTLVDKLQFPKPYTTLRGFRESQTCVSSEMDIPKKGKLATFTMKIMFCMNSSWQGSIKWNEGNREEYFRSVLELIFLINSVLEEI